MVRRFSKRKLVIDLFCLVLLIVLVKLLDRFGEPPRRGFFCDDDSIRYPKVQRETVSVQLLYNVCYSLPAVVFVLVEVGLVFASRSQNSPRTVSMCLLYRLCELYCSFLVGFALEEFTTLVAKFTVGRLRPHFLAACELKQDVCSTLAEPHAYVTEYECTNNHRDTRASFSSGHSALSFYTALYLVIYLHHRLRWSMVSVPRHVTQAGLLIVAYFTALSRVRDYMHHPSDVVAGAIMGCFWAFITTKLLIDMRHRSEEVPGLERNNK